MLRQPDKLQLWPYRIITDHHNHRSWETDQAPLRRRIEPIHHQWQFDRARWHS